jgi:hypothetical protein
MARGSRSSIAACVLSVVSLSALNVAAICISETSPPQSGDAASTLPWQGRPQAVSQAGVQRPEATAAEKGRYCQGPWETGSAERVGGFWQWLAFNGRKRALPPKFPQGSLEGQSISDGLVKAIGFHVAKKQKTTWIWILTINPCAQGKKNKQINTD